MSIHLALTVCLVFALDIVLRSEMSFSYVSASGSPSLESLSLSEETVARPRSMRRASSSR